VRKQRGEKRMRGGTKSKSVINYGAGFELIDIEM
jgi:hypothetical protein